MQQAKIRADQSRAEHVRLQKLKVMRLTERSLHVIGRTSLGMPDQLCFRSSSVTAQSRYKHTATGKQHIHVYSAIVCAALIPRSVFGLASSCLNLSSRLFSRTVMGGAPDAFWSEMRATSGMIGRAGRVFCFCSVERTVAEQGR